MSQTNPRSEGRTAFEPPRLLHGDCLALLPSIPDGCAELIVCDLPYGILNKDAEGGKWDSQIPLEPLWREFLRVTKPNAAIILFAQGMFTAQLMMSQPKLWRYNLIWDKCRSSGFLNANRMPLRSHEDICVFYRELPVYNPQMTPAEKGRESHTRGKAQTAEAGERTNRCYGSFGGVPDGDLTMKFPNSILRFPRPHCTGNHPTEKSVDLCRWLIRSYSNPGDTVLDPTMGSGTTGVAAVLEDRDFVGIEREEKYFAVASRRIEEALTKPRQGELF